MIINAYDFTPFTRRPHTTAIGFLLVPLNHISSVIQNLILFRGFHGEVTKNVLILPNGGGGGGKKFLLNCQQAHHTRSVVLKNMLGGYERRQWRWWI